jgi:ribosome-binding protein aMBF1 (putative translation factor)
MKKDYRKDVRKAIKDSGLPHWRVAQLMDISENTLSRRFRNEMTLEDYNDILAVIEMFKRQTA